MLYGLLVGISCLAALGAIAGSYHYASAQNQLSTVSSSYAGIMRLEEFQLPLSNAQNLSEFGAYARIDGIGLYAANTIVITKARGYSSASLVQQGSP